MSKKKVLKDLIEEIESAVLDACEVKYDNASQTIMGTPYSVCQTVETHLLELGLSEWGEIMIVRP